ncbi:MAG: hypothetical protein GY854_06290 [Deltaproteobacteria bacterium]|nr:hypothetical protein [Deltaproteobacteria bacterium]
MSGIAWTQEIETKETVNNESGDKQTEIEDLKAEIEALKKHNEDRELAELQADAETAITTETEEAELSSKTFQGGERSLQALNPEISVVGDLFARFVYSDGEMYSARGGETGFFPRVAGIHFQSNLDPFSFAKIVIGVTPGGVHFGEGYITWNAATSWLSLTLGKFHQQFGVVNRWHAPGLDQFAYPLVIMEHFGGPLNQTGLSAVITMPLMWADHIDLEIQITNGENARLFAGEFFSIPSGLVHMCNYWDITRNTYLELGLSGLFGVNNAWGQPQEGEPAPLQLYDEGGNPVTFYDENGNPIDIITAPGETSVVNDEDWRLTAIGGADLTINWEPVNQAKYKGFTWRSEFLYAHKKTKDDAGDDDIITSWGAYSYVQYKPIRNWIFGVRGDLTQPFKLDNEGEYTWGIVPYITWWQSPWVRLRLEYDHIQWFEGEPEHRVMFQTTFSAGPHKHERY